MVDDSTFEAADDMPLPTPKMRSRAAKSRATGSANDVVTTLGVAAQGGARRKTAPTPGDWEKYLERILVYGSIAYVWWLTDGAGSTEHELKDEEAAALARPFSRVIARSDFNKRWGKRVLESNDYLDAGIVLIGYGLRTQPLLKAKLERKPATIPSTVRSPNVPSRTTAEPSQSAESGNGFEPAVRVGEFFAPGSQYRE